MRQRMIAVGVIMLLGASDAVAGVGPGDLTGTWEGTAKCRDEGNPDVKRKEAFVLQIDQDLNTGLLAAILSSAGDSQISQDLCGTTSADSLKPEKVAVSLSPFTLFDIQPMFGDYPMHMFLNAVATPAKAKLKGRASTVHQMTKGGITSCKLKFKRTSISTPNLGKLSGACSPGD